MAHIEVDETLPGIRSLLAFRPEVAGPMSELANVLMRDNNGLSPADRELIASHVSYLNGCFYCRHSHEAIACEYLNADAALAKAATENPQQSAVSTKLKALLVIAGSVQQSGNAVTLPQVQHARDEGATDREIHDTVLIAAVFSMFNRYVDGLAANTPADLATYPPRAREVVEHGYKGPVTRA